MLNTYTQNYKRVGVWMYSHKQNVNEAFIELCRLTFVTFTVLLFKPSHISALSCELIERCWPIVLSGAWGLG